MSIALVVTGGYSNGILLGSILDVVLSGYTIGKEVAVVIPPAEPDIGIITEEVSSLPSFLGSGVIMYSKDGSYYILNPEVDDTAVSSAIQDQTQDLLEQIDTLTKESKLLNARVEEAFETQITQEDIEDGNN